MYLPGYNSVLVPAGSDQVPAFDTPPYHTLLQPPRRRRPLLTILKLLQGGRLAVNVDGEIIDLDQPEIEVPRGSETVPGVRESPDRINQNSDKRAELVARLNGVSNVNYGRNIQPEQFTPRYVKLPLVDLGKSFESPDLDDGYSYMYKYSSPNSPTSDGNENVEVSVQRGRNRAYPHVVNQESFEDVKGKIAMKLVDPLAAATRSRAVFRQSIKNEEPHYESNKQTNLRPENAARPDTLKEENKKNSTIVIADVTPDGKEPARLILKPSAKAIAGAKGVAIAAPVARAIIKKGQKVSLEFDPDAVAIAGPGGRAHAHPTFTIDYIDADADLSDQELLRKLSH